MKMPILLGLLLIILPLMIYFFFPVHTALGIPYESLGYITFSSIFTMCLHNSGMFSEPETGVLQRIFPTWLFREGECSWTSPISLLIFLLVIIGLVIIVKWILKRNKDAVKHETINP